MIGDIDADLGRQVSGSPQYLVFSRSSTEKSLSKTMEAFRGFQQRRPPNSAADSVENRIILPGGTEVYYNPATDDVEEYNDGPCGQELTK